MELMEKILSRENMLSALKAVKRNKGAAGIDKVTVDELDEYFRRNWTEIKTAILEKKYKPQPVRRVYIPKSNGKLRPLGIPTVADRVIQQAVAQELVRIFDTSFSNYSHGFRPQRSCHTAMEQVLQNLNDGYEWVVDLDIEKYFDTVNHDKLISILREKVNDAKTLHLVRGFLKAGVMENGVICQNDEGVPQGGPLSPVLSNIYLDRLDKELESRGLRFVRYADDVNIFVKSEMAADRVMKSVTSWLERKLSLKVSATKTKVRVIIVKQWKRPKTIYRNLMKLNRMCRCNMSDEAIFKVANSRLGLYRRCSMDVVNYLLSPKVLEKANKIEGRPALVNPLNYYLS